MQKIMKKTVVTMILGIGVIALNSVACVPAKLTTAQRFEQAQQVFIAKVTGKKQIETQSLSPVSASNEAYPYQINVSVEKTLKSEPESLAEKSGLTYTLSNCGAGKAENGETVLIFVTDGYWYIQAQNEQLVKEINALKKSK